MDASDLKIRVEERGRVRVLAVGGDLDLTCSVAFADQVAVLVERWPGRVVVDLSGLRFADCSGARALAGVAGLPARTRTAVVVRSLRPQIRRVCQLLDLDLKPPESGSPHAVAPPLPGSRTAELVRRSQTQMSRARRTINDSCRIAERIATTEESAAGIFAELATRRPQRRDRLSMLSAAANSHAALMRQHARGPA